MSTFLSLAMFYGNTNALVLYCRLWDSRMLSSGGKKTSLGSADTSETSPLLFEEETAARITCMSVSLFTPKQPKQHTTSNKEKSKLKKSAKAKQADAKKRTDDVDVDIEAMLLNRHMERTQTPMSKKKVKKATSFSRGKTPTRSLEKTPKSRS